MRYMTVKEAARKWKVSERLVQRYCAQGRVKNAKKYGNSWEIPEETKKPEDPRKLKKEMIFCEAEKEHISFNGLMPLMNTAFEPGHCLECINEMEEGPYKRIAYAEYYYFSGHPEKAIQESELYLTCQDVAVRLSACLIYSYANLSEGNIYHARYALAEIKRTLKQEGNNCPQAYAIESFIATAASVLLHLPLPEEVTSIQTYGPYLPEGIRVFAMYMQAHYFYLKKEYEKSLGIIEATLAMQTKIYPVSVIYLHLAAVMDYMSLRQPEKAKEHLLSAWELARPDDLIEGFGEHHGLLGGMLEAVIKKEWPKEFKRMIAITYQFSAGWRKIHNPVTGHQVADNLTTTEFTTAMLAARGWTNQEIADHLQVSPLTVKGYISTVLQKLHVKQRKDLVKYMLR